MPRTELAAATINTPPGTPNPASAALTHETIDDVNGNQYDIKDGDIIVVVNLNVAARNVTLAGAPDVMARDVDAILALAATGSAGDYGIFGPLRLSGWRQTDGKAYIDADGASVEIAVIRG